MAKYANYERQIWLKVPISTKYVHIHRHQTPNNNTRNLGGGGVKTSFFDEVLTSREYFIAPLLPNMEVVLPYLEVITSIFGN